VKTTLTARNLELTDRLRSEIERKLRRLDRVASRLPAEASVELIANASHVSNEAHVAEVTLLVNGSVVRSRSVGATPLAAFDQVIDKLERQVVRAKERPRSVRERQADEGHAVSRRAAVTVPARGLTAEDTALARASVVKLKRFGMEPMFEEDAIARMDELGHGFFVFLNAETDEIAVLYRRRGGGYGLIEPVIDRRGAR
jgi:putative sigma-54 modulation protein